MPYFWNFASGGVDNVPSKELWGDSPMYGLNNAGQGSFYFEDFDAGINAAGTEHAALRTVSDGTTALTYHTTGHAMTISTGGTSNNENSQFLRPRAVIAPNSGKKIWLEARLAVDTAAATGDGGFAFGLCEKSMQVADALVDTSMIVGDFDFVGFKNIPGAGTTVKAVSVLAGTETVVEATAKTIVEGTFYQFGLRFDGKETVFFYVDGVLVGKQGVSATYYDIDESLGLIATAKTLASAAMVVSYDWLAFGAEL